ncbi:phospholipid phosphatase 5 [Culex pipiens pallens]|uniref:phospholipid phosphatase 5 n=1 Tax=Culex pipiens pallens TaxID=42434 RepID=UPI001953A6E3|nr:phospholipid phosphatase 5 [Culex pipiens pallens]
MNRNGGTGGTGTVTATATAAVTQRSNSSPEINLFQEIILRLALFAVYIFFEFQDPFVRKIHPEEMWLYRNPRTESYVPLTTLYPSVFCLVGAVFLTFYYHSRNFRELKCAVLGITLADTLNGVVTHSIKAAVGRPRPDYLWRCFPDGNFREDMVCTGDYRDIRDGRKSFPSGHSSFAFATLGYLSLYLFAKLHVFTRRGRGQSWRLLVAGSPLLMAAMVAISRTCDYHHHWQDISVGSMIGAVLAYVGYRQYYPALNSQLCHLPYGSGDALVLACPSRKGTFKHESSSVDSEQDALLGDDKVGDSKWT